MRKIWFVRYYLHGESHRDSLDTTSLASANDRRAELIAAGFNHVEVVYIYVTLDKWIAVLKQDKLNPAFMRRARNRASRRLRENTLRDLGLIKTKYGWE